MNCRHEADRTAVSPRTRPAPGVRRRGPKASAWRGGSGRGISQCACASVNACTHYTSDRPRGTALLALAVAVAGAPAARPPKRHYRAQVGRTECPESCRRPAQPGRKLGISPIGSPSGVMRCQQTGQAGRAGAKNLGISPIGSPAGAVECQETGQLGRLSARKLVNLGHEVARNLPSHLSFGVKTGQSAQNLGNLARNMTRNWAPRRRGWPR